MDNERYDLPLPEDPDWLDALAQNHNPADASEDVKVYPSHEDADLQLEQILSENWLHAPEEDLSQTRVMNFYQQDAFALPEEEITTVLPSAADYQQTQVVPEIEQEDITRMLPVFPDDGATQAIPNMGNDLEEDANPVKSSRKKKEIPMKSRPRLKKGYGLLGIPHILSTVIWAAIIIAIGVSLGRILWVCCADVMAFGRPDVQATITIEKDDDITAVSQKLKDAGLIAYPELFKMFAEVTGKDERISNGTFNLGSHLDYNAMINAMTNRGGARVEVEVLFPEGINCAQAFRILERNGVCTIADLEEYAANGELKDYWFLEGVPRGDKYCLEGYLAPDTYRFYTNDDPKRVLEKFLDEFDDRFTDIMKENFTVMQGRYEKMMAKNGYSSQYISEHPLTLHQVLTVASIVDRETASDSESYDIASVFYNRLTDPDYPNLGSDATVYYAIGDYFREKESLTEADLSFDSPYNTRVAEGLPPGPICNPSVYSLYAALDPNDTNYRFFIYDRVNYYHLFSKTYKEHMKKAEELGY